MTRGIPGVVTSSPAALVVVFSLESSRALVRDFSASSGLRRVKDFTSEVV